MRDGVNPKEIVRVEDDLSNTMVDGRHGGRRMKGRLAGGVRDALTMAEMKASMAALWKEGELYQVIADKVSDEFGLEGDKRLTANGVHYHLKNLKQQWRDMSLLHVDERQALVLARYDQLELMITEAYFASCRGKTTKNFERQIHQARSKKREEELREEIAEERAGRVNGRNKRNPALQFEFPDGDLPEILMLTEEKIKRSKRKENAPAGDPRWITMLIDINDKRAALWGLKNKQVALGGDAEMAALSDEQREERLAAVLQQVMQRKQSGGTVANTNLAPPAPLGGWNEDEEPGQPPTVPEEPTLVEDEEEELGPAVDDDEDFQFDFPMEDDE